MMNPGPSGSAAAQPPCWNIQKGKTEMKREIHFIPPLFFMSALYILGPGVNFNTALCYLSLDSRSLKASCLGSGPMTRCLAWHRGPSGSVTGSNVPAMPHAPHPLFALSQII